MMQERGEIWRMRLEQLRQEIAPGVDAADRGELFPLDVAAIKAEGRRRIGRGLE